MGEWGALCAITIDAARICRVDHRVGSLKEGKDADIVIFDGNPLQIIRWLNSGFMTAIIDVLFFVPPIIIMRFRKKFGITPLQYQK